MNKDKYHHGHLRDDLIEKGLQLINSAGLEGFSLRKVADMCGVSHAAPYRHFKSREDLIYAITMSVSEKFTSAIEAVLKSSEGDYKRQIIEVGRLYVKFMMENPEHFKFIFLTNHHNPILLRNGIFIQDDKWIVTVFKKIFAGPGKNTGDSENSWPTDAMTVWCLIHGFTTMLINNTIACEGDYLDVVNNMLANFLPNA
ncbi:MAG TPA: TetR/AcrR family transcriptional regulator [Anaerovoracaceae bacterium]|nr:TetR/AcrR family transcriptional regulator [Anaerovoracaceae bacterium]